MRNHFMGIHGNPLRIHWNHLSSSSLQKRTSKTSQQKPTKVKFRTVTWISYHWVEDSPECFFLSSDDCGEQTYQSHHLILITSLFINLFFHGVNYPKHRDILSIIENIPIIELRPVEHNKIFMTWLNFHKKKYFVTY